MRASPDLRRAVVNVGNRWRPERLFVIALMVCLVIAELFLRLMRAYS